MKYVCDSVKDCAFAKRETVVFIEKELLFVCMSGFVRRAGKMRRRRIFQPFGEAELSENRRFSVRAQHLACSAQKKPIISEKNVKRVDKTDKICYNDIVCGRTAKK